jgi:hypothetical protein
MYNIPDGNENPPNPSEFNADSLFGASNNPLHNSILKDNPKISKPTTIRPNIAFNKSASGFSASSFDIIDK